MFGSQSSRTTVNHQQSYKFGFAIFIIIAALYAMGVAFLFRSDYMSEGILMAAAFDGLVVLPVLFYVLCIRNASRRKEWVIAVAAAAAVIIYVLTPAEHNRFLSSILRWLILVVEFGLITYMLLRLTAIVKRYRSIASMTAQPPMAVLREALIPVLGSGVLLEIVMSELGVFYYSIIAGIKRPDAPKETSFTYHQTSQFKTVSIVFSIIILLETVGLHVLLSMWSPLLAWIFGVLNVYGILYLVAMSRSMACLPHMLDERQLYIQNGFQSSAVIPLHAIHEIVKAKPLELGEKIPKHMYAAYPRIDTPQFEIRLKHPVPMRGPYGIKKQVSIIVISVDEPQAFMAEWERLSQL